MEPDFRFIKVVPEGKKKAVRILTGIYCDKSKDYDEVTELVIPKNTHSISSDVFPRFKNLRSVKLPEGLTDFGAFTDLEYLEGVELPDTVLGIDEDAFYNCRSIKSLTIPANVSSIGGAAFYGSGIEELTFRGIDRLKRVKYNTFAGVYNIRYNLPDAANKRTVEYTPEMGVPNLTEGYRERAKGKTLYEQAMALQLSPESFKSELYEFAPYITASKFSAPKFIEDWSRVESFIVDDGVIIGYNIYMWKNNKEISRPVLIGVPTCLSHDVSYAHTGDNNGAGYKGDDDDGGYATPMYTLLYKIGEPYPTSDSFDQAENADPVSN